MCAHLGGCASKGQVGDLAIVLHQTMEVSIYLFVDLLVFDSCPIKKTMNSKWGLRGPSG